MSRHRPASARVATCTLTPSGGVSGSCGHAGHRGRRWRSPSSVRSPMRCAAGHRCHRSLQPNRRGGRQSHRATASVGFTPALMIASMSRSASNSSAIPTARPRAVVRVGLVVHAPGALPQVSLARTTLGRGARAHGSPALMAQGDSREIARVLPTKRTASNGWGSWLDIRARFSRIESRGKGRTASPAERQDATWSF